jgi:hypothetical protein
MHGYEVNITELMPSEPDQRDDCGGFCCPNPGFIGHQTRPLESLGILAGKVSGRGPVLLFSLNEKN